jgi:hypothetical protein
MTKELATIALALLSVTAALAQIPCFRTGPLTAQERIAQRDIQSRIDETIEADQAKDFEAKVRYFSPDFTLRLVDGSVISREETEKDLKRDMDWILSVSDLTTTKVECFQLEGTEAAAITNQHYVRTVPDRKDGSPHELITDVTHWETWIYTPSGWMVKTIVVLKQGPIYLDGELYEP